MIAEKHKLFCGCFLVKQATCPPFAPASSECQAETQDATLNAKCDQETM